MNQSLKWCLDHGSGSNVITNKQTLKDLENETRVCMGKLHEIGQNQKENEILVSTPGLET